MTTAAGGEHQPCGQKHLAHLLSGVERGLEERTTGQASLEAEHVGSILGGGRTGGREAAGDEHEPRAAPQSEWSSKKNEFCQG